MHVTNSERVAGVGLFAGGAYASMKQVTDFFTFRARRPVVDDFDEYYTKSAEAANSNEWITYANNAAS